MSSAARVILAYHRVARAGFDPQRLCVSPEHFAQQLQALRELAEPCRLEQLLTAPPATDGRPRVAVTFDDGYADLQHAALPLLRESSVPATVFVVAGALDDPGQLWWEVLERCLFEPRELPPRLLLRVDGRDERWEPESWQTGWPGPRHARWTVTERRDPGPRHALYRRLHAALAGVSGPRRRALLDRLCRWAGVAPTPAPGHRPVDAPQLIRLARAPEIDIGGHAYSHCRLAALPPRQRLEELTQGRRVLEAVLGSAPRTLAYPFGTAHEVGRTTAWLARAAGYELACMGVGGALPARVNRWRLPRLPVPDVDGEAFARWLSRSLQPA